MRLSFEPIHYHHRSTAEGKAGKMTWHAADDKGKSASQGLSKKNSRKSMAKSILSLSYRSTDVLIFILCDDINKKEGERRNECVCS